MRIFDYNWEVDFIFLFQTMFSEYMDDGMAKNENEKKKKEKAEEKVEGEGEKKDESEQTKQIELLKSEISSKASGYKSFFDSYPNSFHENISWLSVRQWLYESFASEIWGITEKKIKWFNRELWDGKRAEVREKWWQIYLKITQEWIILNK